MAVLKWVFMALAFGYGFFNKGGGRGPFDLLPLLDAIGGSFDRMFRRALGAILLAGLAASLMVAGIVMTIVTGVFMANGAALPEITSLLYAGLGVIGSAVLLGLIAVLVARGSRSSLSAQLRRGYDEPWASVGAASAAYQQPRAGQPLEEAVAALIMDFVQSRRAARGETEESRAQRQNVDRDDSEFANREFMN